MKPNLWIACLVAAAIIVPSVLAESEATSNSTANLSGMADSVPPMPSIEASESKNVRNSASSNNTTEPLMAATTDFSACDDSTSSDYVFVGGSRSSDAVMGSSSRHSHWYTMTAPAGTIDFNDLLLMGQFWPSPVGSAALRDKPSGRDPVNCRRVPPCHRRYVVGMRPTSLIGGRPLQASVIRRAIVEGRP